MSFALWIDDHNPDLEMRRMARSRPQGLAPVPPVPPPWTNQDIFLFHGTLQAHVASILGGINLTVCHPRTDFGRGHYTTTSLPQAQNWAWQLSVRNPGSQPAVVRFVVSRDKLTKLDTLWFVRGDFHAADYWSLVWYCRSGGPNHHRPLRAGWYDVVVGPVARSWHARRSFTDYDQASFHTRKGVRLLSASSPREVNP